MNKSKKKRKKLIRNAQQRSETVFVNSIPESSKETISSWIERDNLHRNDDGMDPEDREELEEQLDVIEAYANEVQDVIYLESPEDLEEGPTAKCTCGWSYGPDTNLFALGYQAKKHSVKIGHQLRGHGSLT